MALATAGLYAVLVAAVVSHPGWRGAPGWKLPLVGLSLLALAGLGLLAPPRLPSRLARAACLAATLYAVLRAGAAAGDWPLASLVLAGCAMTLLWPVERALTRRSRPEGGG